MILNEIIKSLSAFFRHDNDDFVDRMHYMYTVGALAIFLVCISAKLQVGEVIQCVVPIGTHQDTAKYIQSICWTNGTNLVEYNPTKGNNMYTMGEKRITYYQWIICIVVLQCLIFNIPSYVWQLMVKLNGFDMVHVIRNIMRKTYQEEYSDPGKWQDTERVVESITDHLRMSFLNDSRQLSKQMRVPSKSSQERKLQEMEEGNIRRSSPKLKAKAARPLFWPYMLMKTLALINVLAHFMLLSFIFQFDYFSYGVTWFQHETRDNINRFFPLRASCLTSTDGLVNPHFSLHLCSLPLNLYNQFFYLGLWYWLVILAFATLGSMIYWLSLVSPWRRRRLVLEAMNLDEHARAKAAGYTDLCGADRDAWLQNMTGRDVMQNFELFYRDVCTLDVVFVIKLLALNTSGMAARDILQNLWHHYLDLGEQQPPRISRPILKLRKRELETPESGKEETQNLVNETEDV